MRIGFLTPLPAEYKTFPRSEGKLLNGDQYLVQRCGIGYQAVNTAENLISDGAELLIGWGVGGSIDPKLKTGDLLISSSIKDQRGGLFEFQTNFTSILSSAFLHCLHFQPKHISILSVDQMVLNQEEKKLLFEKYQSPIIDMESAIIAQTAKKSSIPYICVRAVCDEFDTTMPNFLNQILNGYGETNLPALLRNIIVEPAQ